MHWRPLPFVLASAAIAAGCSGSVPPPVPQMPAGERIYAGNCIACHQPAGQGIAGVYPALAGSAVVLGDPSGLAAWIVKGRRPATITAGRYTTVMPQFAWLRADEAAALISYLRSSFGNHAGSVDAASVADALQ